MQVTVTGRNIDLTPALKEYLMEKLQRSQKHFDHALNVTALLSVAPAHWQKYHLAACVLATCARLADQDAKLSPEQRRQRNRAYGEQAVVVLRKAITNGYKDAQFLRSSPAFDALRSRDDFKELVGRLDGAKAAKNR